MTLQINNILHRRHARELGLVHDEPSRKETCTVIPAEEYGVVGPEGQLPPLPDEASQVVAAAEETAAAAGAGYGADSVMQEEPQDAVQAAVEVVNETLLPVPVPVADPTKCSIEGCDLPPGTGGYKGMCVKHWLEIEKQKAANETHRRRKRCSVDGCDKQAREYGMCHRHGRIHHGDQQNRGQMSAAIAADVADEVLSPSKRRKMDALVDVAAVVDDAAAAAAHHHDPHHEMVPGDDLDHVAVQDGVNAAIEAVTAAELPDTTGMTREDNLAAAAEAAAEAVAAAAAVEDAHTPQHAAI